MYPVALDLQRIRIALTGNGPAALRRLAQLDEDGARHVTVFAPYPSPALAEAAGSRLRARLPDAEDLEAAQVAMIVDLEEETAAALAQQARALGRLVNVEDRPEYCDFHFTGFVRRGDLLLSVSTNGKSPALARRIHKELEALFGEEWGARLDDIAGKREEWKREGLSMQEVMERSDAHIERKGWLSSLRATNGSEAARNLLPLRGRIKVGVASSKNMANPHPTPPPEGGGSGPFGSSHDDGEEAA